MALENAAPIIGMKDRSFENEDSLIHYGVRIFGFWYYYMF